MAFAWDAKRFENLDQFRSYVFSLPKPPWMRRVIMHHTWKPVQADWRGLQSMDALERYYRDQVVWYDKNGVKHKGWPAGPHLFVCTGSPNPALYDGIFQGTPINVVGVHAGECNDGIGLEDVGTFDQQPWGADLRALNIGVVQALLDWTDLTPDRVFGHRDCNSPKTCPGSAVDLNQFRRELSVEPWHRWGTTYPLPVDQRGWGIPQAWLPRSAELMAAVALPEYQKNTSPETVIQRFEGGVVVYRDQRGGYAHTWEELLK